MSIDPRDNEAQVADGMSDVMAGSTIAFMAVTVFMIVALLALLLVLNIKREEAGLIEQLQQRLQAQQEELTQAREQAQAARAQAAQARAAAAGGIHVSAGYQLWEGTGQGVTYLTDIVPKERQCEAPISIKLVCRAPGYRESKTLECDPEGKFSTRGVIPR